MKIKVNNNMPLSHIDNRQAFRALNEKGIITIGTPGDEKPNRMYNTAPLISTPNINASLGALNYINPQAIEVLTAVRTADRIAKPTKVATWGDTSYTIQVKEYTGVATPDDGSAFDGKKSGLNYSYYIRGIKYFCDGWGTNDIEQSQYSKVKTNVVDDKVKASMNTLSINRNLTFFKGIEETWNQNNIYPVYGLLNDPNLKSYNVVEATQSGSTYWADKDPNQIANDVIQAYGQLIDQTGALVEEETNRTLKLVVSSHSYTYLIKPYSLAATLFTAQMIIEQNIPGIEIICSPELNNANNSSDVFYLIYENSAYGETISNPYVEMARAYPIFVQDSETSQKISSGILGCIVNIPMFITRWTGIGNNTTSTPVMDINSYSH